MRFYFKMALRNLFRQVRRTVLTMSAIIAGIGVLILGDGFIAGLKENIIVSAIEGTTSHFTVRPAKYPTEGMQHPVDELLTLTPAARTFLNEKAEAWTGRTYFMPTAVAGVQNMRVRAIGYDPKTDPTVFPRRLWAIQGRDPVAEKDEILVSPKAAKNLHVGPDDHMVLQVRTHTGAINALEVVVAGIVRTTHTTIDQGAILVPAPLAARLINSELPSHISVLTSSRQRGLELAPDFAKAMGAQAEVITWDSETVDLLRLQRIRRKALQFIVFILLALAAFGMANTILMAAYERVREVGTLRAMGMTRRGVMWLFLVEGSIMGLAGSTLGALWGGGLTYHWSVSPLDFSAAAENMGNGLQFSTLIYTAFSAQFIVGAVLFGMIIATIAALYPARVAARMMPADAVRA